MWTPEHHYNRITFAGVEDGWFVYAVHGYTRHIVLDDKLTLIRHGDILHMKGPLNEC